MADEFSESEIVFSDQHHPPPQGAGGSDDCRELVVELPKKQNSRVGSGEAENKRVTNSVPVNIPDMMLRRWGSGEEEAEDEEDMVPPHVIVARRIAGKMAFSVCTGNGRTLKGRDLSRVRNSVLRLTGFLEV